MSSVGIVLDFVVALWNMRLLRTYLSGSYGSDENVQTIHYCFNFLFLLNTQASLDIAEFQKVLCLKAIYLYVLFLVCI
jgi:hypothetical protein